MKNFKIKFFVAILSFVIGVSIFHINHNIRSFLASDNFNPVMPNFTSGVTTSPLTEKKFSSKIEIRFIRFVQEDFESEVELEITNNTAENFYYYSYSKNSYPFPTIKRNGKVVPHRGLRCGTGISKQTLLPGEAVFFRVPKSEMTYELTQDLWRESDKPTQIGFLFETEN